MRVFLPMGIAAASVCACATLDRNVEPFDEQEYMTGSNIPRRDVPKEPVTVLSKDAFEGLQRWLPTKAPEGSAGRGH